VPCASSLVQVRRWGYPSIYQGCHWGNCTSGGLSGSPVQVSSLTTGKVTTSWSTTQPGGSNDYDVAYDIWFNQTQSTTGQPNCTELMVWLNHNGPVQPFGSQVATGVSVGGRGYNVWEGSQGSFDTVSCTMTTATTSVSGLDLAPLAQDAVNRGYLSRSCYLIDIEAGFELWQGGAGLAANSYPGCQGVNKQFRTVAIYATNQYGMELPQRALRQLTRVSGNGLMSCSDTRSKLFVRA
jgi:Glycosyl hydrolase family 12